MRVTKLYYITNFNIIYCTGHLHALTVLIRYVSLNYRGYCFRIFNSPCPLQNANVLRMEDPRR